MLDGALVGGGEGRRGGEFGTIEVSSQTQSLGARVAQGCVVAASEVEQ